MASHILIFLSQVSCLSGFYPFYHRDPALAVTQDTINLWTRWRMVNSGLEFQSGKLWLSHTPGLWSRKSQTAWQSYSNTQTLHRPFSAPSSRWLSRQVGSTATPSTVGNREETNQETNTSLDLCKKKKKNYLFWRRI